MKLTEEQATELMQYVTERRISEYEYLKSCVKKEMGREGKHYMNVPISNYYLFGDCMLRIGTINSLYRLLYKVGAISWDDVSELMDEVYDKFDIDAIREEIRNQRSLEK